MEQTSLEVSLEDSMRIAQSFCSTYQLSCFKSSQDKSQTTPQAIVTIANNIQPVVIYSNSLWVDVMCKFNNLFHLMYTADFRTGKKTAVLGVTYSLIKAYLGLENKRRY